MGHLVLRRFVDDVSIWEVALSEEQILGLYSQNQPVYGCTNEEPAITNQRQPGVTALAFLAVEFWSRDFWDELQTVSAIAFTVYRCNDVG